VISWNIIRAAGIGAFLMLWGSVVWGLVSTTSVFGKKIPKPTSVALHQALSTSGLLLLAMHLGFLLADRFMPFTPLDLVIPMRATYRPIGVTLGIASVFVMVLGVLSTSWGRKLIGTKWWRRTHALSVPAFALALMHGLMTGTDSRRPAMFWMYLATAAILLFLLLLRALTADRRSQRAALPEGAVRRAPAATARPGRSSAEPEPAVAAVTLGKSIGAQDRSPAPPPRPKPRPSFAKPPIPVMIVQAAVPGALNGGPETDGSHDPSDIGNGRAVLERPTGAAVPTRPDERALRRRPDGNDLSAATTLGEKTLVEKTLAEKTPAEKTPAEKTLAEKTLADHAPRRRSHAPRPPPTNHGRPTI
jgi:DMSO/TMAO reductase YedYZ heme-binding membrane subunit